jgi:predicted nucleotidyltransferase
MKQGEILRIRPYWPTHFAIVSGFMTIPLSETETLAHILADQPDVQFAVLVGSRATGTAGPHSDWDIAMQWAPQQDWLSVLGSTETLRHTLAEALRISPSDIDLIDLRRANLAMRASVAEEGLPLAGEDTLAWAHFLLRTWRELEDFYWDRRHAA